MLIWIFGSVKRNEVIKHERDHAEGFLELERAHVKWFLSINYNHIPEEVKRSGKRTFRALEIEDEALEFSEGFTDLHTLSYQEILRGHGFGIADARPSIDVVHAIRK